MAGRVRNGVWPLVGILTAILILIAFLTLSITPNFGSGPGSVNLTTFSNTLANWSSLHWRFAIATVPWILAVVFGLPYFQAVRRLYREEQGPLARSGATMLSIGLVAEAAAYLATYGYMSTLSAAYSSAIPSDRPDLVAFGGTTFNLIGGAGDGFLAIGVSSGLVLFGLAGLRSASLPSWSSYLAIVAGLAGVIALLISLFVPAAEVVALLAPLILVVWLFVSAVRLRGSPLPDHGSRD
jgi:hypothetical protein